MAADDLLSQKSVRELFVALVAFVREEVKRASSAGSLPSEMDDYLSTRAASKLADVKAGTIRRWISEGKLRPYHAGRHVRVRRGDLEAFLKNGRRKDSSKLTAEEIAFGVRR